jgi:excisionase family DNA binding protein
MRGSEEKMCKVWDLERELSVSRATIYLWCQRGAIEYVRLPSGHIRIPHNEVEKLKCLAK